PALSLEVFHGLADRRRHRLRPDRDRVLVLPAARRQASSLRRYRMGALCGRRLLLGSGAWPYHDAVGRAQSSGHAVITAAADPAASRATQASPLIQAARR